MSMIEKMGAGWRLSIAAVVCALAGVGAGWYWSAQNALVDPAGGVSDKSRAAIEKVVRDYVIANPEILPEAMENLRRKEDSKRLAGIQGEVEKPFPGSVRGNPDGKITLVEFSDFACGYCRQSEADVEALIAANPDLKVVIRHLPILSPQSADAARMGLAAARQGKYPAFHRAMFAAGRPSPQTIEAAARVAGLDLARARADSASPQIAAEIDRNLDFARQLGFQGTPSWVIGSDIHGGAVGKAELAKSIDKARG